MSSLANIQSKRAWLGTLAAALLFLAVIPILNLYVPEQSLLHVPDYIIQLLGKFLCYALCALAIDLIWGFTGILSLGHGVFFALGGYAMGMYLMRAMAGMGVYKSNLPDFMVFLDWKELPWFWLGFDHFWFAMLMVVLVPGVFAFIFGFFAFRSRIKGVYLSIITQALTYAMMLLFFRNNTGFGGNNGLTDFKTLLGFSLLEPSTKLGLYMISVAAVLLGFLVCRYITSSKLGRVLTAIRDAESRVMFSGYSPLQYKLFVWTLSAVMCGIAGALYVPQVGIINPSEMAPANSIEMVIWVAVGGRGSLMGALLGTGIVNGAKSWFTAAAPDYWLYFLGALFIGTTLFLPRGIVGIANQLRVLRRRLASKHGSASPATQAKTTKDEG
ncbi:leucine/isoleucine/valine transporter permease subunit [Pseudodesulfovibrio hydrargyri]|uniref:Leucine/isoleucine/valine transporter permease subunit n=1 Tax=Pseudodesulfovibrio hydrargyri TaxID=2125990 RepID=A0A1J5MSP2_9BACT|nr:urea ABC transporter permease subunit UrtC [Pseudodesulfovibrio hydrargyri]OIQ49026.1 leucine/isoleucine/valine transporter permease subunit [Pseudodesulfovibrio hydrargyri]